MPGRAWTGPGFSYYNAGPGRAGRFSFKFHPGWAGLANFISNFTRAGPGFKIWPNAGLQRFIRSSVIFKFFKSDSNEGVIVVDVVLGLSFFDFFFRQNHLDIFVFNIKRKEKKKVFFRRFKEKKSQTFNNESLLIMK